MSYNEAKVDGVRREIHDDRIMYLIPCQFCGAPVQCTSYVPTFHYTCRECKPIKRVLLKTGLFPIKRTLNDS